MTWINFMGWLGGFYVFYYAVNILWDMKRAKPETADAPDELVFEAHTPEKVGVEEKVVKKTEKSVPPVIDSGGLRLRQLFAAAKAETIIYTGGVTY